MKLVTWNTQWCRGLDGIVSVQRIVDGARAMADFDVLCVQEIAQGYAGMPGAPGDQPAELQALLPGFQLFFGAAVDEFDAQGTRQRFGNLIATRLPVLQVQHHALPCPADAGVRSMPRMCTVVTVRDPLIGPLRVMTTHLEYYSKVQRMAQARALRQLHIEACGHAAEPPLYDTSRSPFQNKVHTPHAILCGDFNLGAEEPEYAVMQAPFGLDTGTPTRCLQDAWPLANRVAPHAPTFRLFDRTYGPEPVACDFAFVSDGLAPRVERVDVDLATQASDHQPVLLVLG
ncbi:endonuclease/exonuclease/phosphatase family protein [Variovorax sp. PAMC 28711]|uniref:endonuclease/exonuclease/phosphatase family protein n=1 Tax=Variovorax sp. PAMC 28711 TaxID=1795631 RepID=UPI00078C74C2|nr:endonuclease/exonuclease/phosphatase family protein [Variovorax sp. PAMC 28711]AMM23122.1 endonuclease [Variovorax sp. PAMC 28711]